ncbi:C-X-C chemokine receptor type 5 isoform X1 [Misgurnus anguillicaudatus]|uniref:C-X-C chemokine receptor type 5 isoform X1 n=2 Tax=Misgurnus anguillicaudatus TaxID=75329 RepID=UPI003CCFA9DC
MVAHITMNMDEITDIAVFENFEYTDLGYENVTENPLDMRSYTCDNTTSLHLFHTVLQPLIFGLVFVLGLAGNGLLLTVLLKRWKNLRITEIYLVHLALADLLLLLTFPFAVTQGVAGWVFGEFLCKLVGLINRLNLVCGSLLLACIGIDRYLAIVHAIPSLQSRRPKIVHFTCGLLWLLCLSVSIPNMVFLSVAARDDDGRTRLSCTYNSHREHARHWKWINRFFTHLLCFFLPLMVMVYCYSAIIITLYQSQKSLEKQGAMRLALLVTLVFCLCWLPFNISILIDTLVKWDAISVDDCHVQTMLEQTIIVTESIGYTHCCLNPVLYAFIGVRFRRDLLQLIAKRKFLRLCLSGPRVESQRSVSVTEAATTTTSSHYF